MQLSDKSGIKCDKCGMEFRQDFNYYNFDFKKYVNTQVNLQTLSRLSTNKSLDICTECFEKISHLIVTNYQTYQRTKVQKCELTGTQLARDLYHVEVQKVEVNINNQPYICTGCKKSARSPESCQCGSRSFVRPAKTRVTNNIVQFECNINAIESWGSNSKNNQEWNTSS
jgi:hypothetical protein